MRTVYASVLDVIPEPSEGASNCFQRLVGVIIDWVEQSYQRKWDILLKLALNGAAIVPAPDHSVLGSSEKAESCDLAIIDWSHPGDPGSELQWNTVCNLARCEDAIQVSVAVRIFSLNTVIKPLTFTIGRPRLIDDILAAVPCFIGKQQIPKSPIDLSAPDVAGFVENTLFSTERPLPVIVISPDVWTGRLEVGTASLQKTLLGFAQVAALRDKWAAFKLTDCLGKELSCYNGAVRLYWPGLEANSNPFDHPLYFADSIRWQAENNHPLDSHLFRLLVGISAFRFSEAPIVRSARSAVEKLKHQHIQQVLAQAKAGGTELQEIETELARAWDEIDQLKRERDQAKEQVSELNANLETQKAAWGTVQQASARSQSPLAATSPKSENQSFDSVADVAAWAKNEFAETLFFLDSAIDSAVDSPYQHPDRVSQLFQALNELVCRWKSEGKLGETWVSALKQRGFDYKDQISKTSLGMYADDYKFIYQGKKRLIENHVTIGAKQADSCLSVHWFRDDKNKVLVIGSCGRHGTNTSS